MRVFLLRVAVMVTCLVAALAASTTAQARYVPGGPRSGGDVDATPAVVLKSALGAGETFGGLEAPHSFNPLEGYPSPGYDTAGFTTVPAGFGGVILGTTIAGETLSLYCVDHNTDTSAGIGYDPGAWNLSKVPHLGYVLRILQKNYPATGEPSTAPTNNRRAAAVQAAIWFFTDRFVLASTDARFALTAQIVAAALAAGPVTEPQASLHLTGPTTADVERVAGPFAVHGAVSEATLHVTHGVLYADAQGEHQLTNGAAYPVNTTFWLRSPEPAISRITATAVVQNPIGRAFLYAPTDPDNPVPAAAQKLILALPGEVRTTAQIDVTFCSPGTEEENGTSEENRTDEDNGTGGPTPEHAKTCGKSKPSLPRTGTDMPTMAGIALAFATLGGIITATTGSRRFRSRVTTGS